jgi:transposase
MKVARTVYRGRRHSNVLLLPKYRQEGIFERAGMAIARSTLAQWVGLCGAQLQPLVDALREELLAHAVLHADETPVAMLKPGNGKTHRAYLWSYCTTSMNPTKAVVYDFAESHGGRHAGQFLGRWHGTLVCDDYSGYVAAEFMLRRQWVPEEAHGIF